MASWRAVLAATVTAVVATGALSMAVDAAPAPGRRAATMVHSPAVATKHVAAVAPLPPVTEHALDPAVVAAAAVAPSNPAGSRGQSVTQTIQLTIIGGELSLASDHATVTLERVAGSHHDWVGTLPPVRVVDARGTGAGWTVRWTVADIDVQGEGPAHRVTTAKVRLEPGAPVVVAGLPDGIAAGRPGPATRHGRTLFSAARGTGGGTYEAGGVVTMRLPHSVDAESVVVDLAFTVR
jgi:hypothetical protein